MIVEKRLLPAVLFVFLLLPGATFGEIYGWVVENEVKHYSNEPPPEGVKAFAQTAEITSGPAEEQKRAESDQQLMKQLEEQAPEEQTPLEQSAGADAETGKPDAAAAEEDDREVFHRERIKRRTRQNTSPAPSMAKRQ
jgi:hypothetical protein